MAPPDSGLERIRRVVATWVDVAPQEDAPSPRVDALAPAPTVGPAMPMVAPAQNDPDQEEDQHGSDKSVFDINLAEFPFAYLSKKLGEGCDRREIRYSDQIRGRGGEMVSRTWVVRGSETYGIGGPSSVAVLYELMQIWKEQGFSSDKIHIGSYYNLLQRLSWGRSRGRYRQLLRDLACLYDLEIAADNAYYDKEKDRYESRRYRLFSGAGMSKREAGKAYTDEDRGFLVASQMFYESVRKNAAIFVPFTKEYFRTLTPMEQKLALYLAKVFTPYRERPRPTWSKRLAELAQQLPITSVEGWRIKYRVQQIVEGLVAKDFPLLNRSKPCEFVSIRGDEWVVFHNSESCQLGLMLDTKDTDRINYLTQEQLEVCGDARNERWYRYLAARVPDDLIFSCLSEAKASAYEYRRNGQACNIGALYTSIIKTKAAAHVAGSSS